MKYMKNTFFLIFAILLVRPIYSQDWQFECIDSTLGPSHHRQMILDQQNLPHIFFYNMDNEHLMRYYKTDSGWDLIDYNIFFVPEGVDIGPDQTFHLTQGGENVVYYMLTNQDTTYIDTIYVGNLPILASRVCVDNNGDPQIIAGAYDTGQIFHIFRENSAWIVDQVLNFYPYLTDISMKIDIFDNIHLAMAGNIPPAIGYACEYPDWSWSVLIDSVAQGNVILELSGDFSPGIAYNYTPPEGVIKPGLLEFNDLSWDTTYFESSFVLTSISSFAYDVEMTPHLILYKRGIPPDDRTAIHTYRTNNIWVYDTLFTDIYIPNNIKSDSNGNLHLDYSRSDNRGFFYGIKHSNTDIKEIEIPENRYFKLLDSYPNPFNSNTVITLKGSEGGDRVLEIFDITGALLRTLNLKEGKTSWDARDNLGRRVSSGIYFARVETPQGSIQKKLIFLK